MRLLLRLRPLLEHRYLGFYLAALAVLLASPSLTTGWVLDDYTQRLIAVSPAEELPANTSRLDMFSMTPDGEASVRLFRDMGFAPWWTPDDFRLGFWRPLASAHHLLQYRLWPNTAWPMHLVSLAWLGLAIILATQFFRRFIPTPWIAGLAALLYAFQPGHTMTAGWIANQNALLSVTWGLASILTHDRWRVRQWKPGAILSPLFLGLAVLSGESATAAGGYLFAYALFCDPIKMKPRALLMILPHAVVGIAWALVYKLGGYSVSGSGFYIDPLGETDVFLRAVIERSSVNLASVWALVPSTMIGLMSAKVRPIISMLCWMLVLFLSFMLLPALRRKWSSGFFILALVLSLIPIAATDPSERNVMWAGLAGVALLAQGIGAVYQRVANASGGAGGLRPPKGFYPRLALITASGLLWIHLFLGPLQALGNSVGFASFRGPRETGFDAVLQDEAIRHQMVVLLNPPVPFMASSFPAYFHSKGRPFPERFRHIAAGIYPMTLTTLDAHTISIRSEAGGILQPHGMWDVPGQPHDPGFSLNYLAQAMDSVFRSERLPFTVGETTETIGMTARVVEVASGGGVKEVHFMFDKTLDDPDLRWLKWEGKGFVETRLPPVGSSLDLPAVDLGANL